MFYFGGAGTGDIRIGIFSSSQGAPNALIADGGTQTATGSNTAAWTLPAPVKLKRGVYWMVVFIEGSVTTLPTFVSAQGVSEQMTGGWIGSGAPNNTLRGVFSTS